MDGWLTGHVVKVPTKYSTSTTIGYKVGIDFDNGDRNQLLTFNPKDERWRIYNIGEKRNDDGSGGGGGAGTTTHAQAKKDDLSNKEMKKTTEKKKKNVKNNIKVKDQSTSLVVATRRDAKTAKSVKKEDVSDFVDRMMLTTTTTTSMTTATKMSSIPTNNKDKDSKELLVRYSPASILAVRAAHAKSSTTTSVASATSSSSSGIFPSSSSTSTTTTTIGYSPSLPRGTLSPNEKSKRHSRELERKVKSTKAYQVSLICPQDPMMSTASTTIMMNTNEMKKKKYSKTPTAATPGATSSTKLPTKDNNNKTTTTTTSTVDNAVTLQGLMKRECNRADVFVDYMTASTKVGVAPESTESDSLELKLDQE
jgi:hypothetical protein